MKMKSKPREECPGSDVCTFKNTVFVDNMYASKSYNLFGRFFTNPLMQAEARIRALWISISRFFEMVFLGCC